MNYRQNFFYNIGPREAFKEAILEPLDWMDEQTKFRARMKLEKMEQSIAYSDEFVHKKTVDDLVSML